MKSAIVINCVGKRNKHRLEVFFAGSAQEKPNRGEVVAVGSGRILDSGDVQVDVKWGYCRLWSIRG